MCLQNKSSVDKQTTGLKSITLEDTFWSDYRKSLENLTKHAAVSIAYLHAYSMIILCGCHPYEVWAW